MHACSLEAHEPCDRPTLVNKVTNLVTILRCKDSYQTSIWARSRELRARQDTYFLGEALAASHGGRKSRTVYCNLSCQTWTTSFLSTNTDQI